MVTKLCGFDINSEGMGSPKEADDTLFQELVFKRTDIAFLLCHKHLFEPLVSLKYLNGLRLQQINKKYSQINLVKAI